jgi:HEAT repeat protein
MHRETYRIRKAALCGILVTLACLFAQRQAECEETVAAFFNLQDPKVTLHEPVYMNFSVSNHLAEALDIDLGFDRKESFRFSITRPDGSIARAGPYRRGGLGVTGSVTVGPGQTYTQAILLNEFFDFGQLGDYVIVAEITTPFRTTSGRAVRGIPPANVTLHLAGRDPKRLVEVSDRLTKEAIQPGSQSAMEAAFALAYVRDPVAIPYLNRVLGEATDSAAKYWAVKGLARIKSPDAINALESHLKTADPLLKYYINLALLEVKEGREFQSKD